MSAKETASSVAAAPHGSSDTLGSHELKNPAAEHWKLPAAPPQSENSAHPLCVYNSLTRTKVPFIPISGRRVLWYMCGPTVYDSAHMGHARTYITFDVLRRILVDYFNYDVLLTMNITDIDDKIIRKANEAGEPFDKISRHFESEFLADMALCGVSPPDVMTRVSEYVPEIVSFIQKIIDNGFAYESNGSVYFNVNKFSADKSHTYAKLVPENANNSEALEEGEGVLSAKAAGHADDKHSPSDFALWKKSKEGEPWWESPWGQGRPGWHIECSTMCQATLGEFAGGPIDVHSGGIDLRFPHHDNEIAQSEAFLDHPQWVNYFLHTGHLNIDGLKMSKSLKNFIKISSAIERYGARRLRLLFLLYKYNAPMDYSEDVMVLVTAIERSFVEYFSNVKSALRSLPTSGPAKWSSREIALANVVDHAKAKVRAALCDDFDTPVCPRPDAEHPLSEDTFYPCTVQTVINVLREVVTETNKYIAGEGAPPGATPIPYALRASADFVSSIFRLFGLIDPIPSIGFTVGGEGASLEQTLTPYLDAMANFRETVRDAARAKEFVKVLEACDALRDEILPPLGVKLEDALTGQKTAAGAGESAVPATATWKLREPAELLREMEDRKLAVLEKQRQKEEAAVRKRKEEEEKKIQGSIKPEDVFRLQHASKYSAFDEKGFPTHDAEGKLLSDKSRAKLQAVYDKQAKLHEWFLSL